MNNIYLWMSKDILLGHVYDNTIGFLFLGCLNVVGSDQQRDVFSTAGTMGCDK